MQSSRFAYHDCASFWNEDKYTPQVTTPLGIENAAGKFSNHKFSAGKSKTSAGKIKILHGVPAKLVTSRK